MKAYKPKSIQEAINIFEVFLECDLYTKFRPQIKMGKKRWYRQDYFKDEKEFQEYLQYHFDILRKEVRRLK